MELTNLEQLLKLLRAQGVTEFADENLVIKLGEKPHDQEADPFRKMAQDRDAVNEVEAKRAAAMQSMVDRNPQVALMLKPR